MKKSVIISQCRQTVFIKREIQLTAAKYLMLNKILYDQVGAAACRQRVSRSPDQIPGLVQIQLQRDAERKRCAFLRNIIRISLDF